MFFLQNRGYLLTQHLKSTRRKLYSSSSGQAVIEFVLTMLILLTLLLFIIQATLFLSFGNFVQYATFMSARAYLSAWPTKNLQREHAEAVLRRTVKKSGGEDRIPLVAKGTDGNSQIKGADIGGFGDFKDCNSGKTNTCVENSSWQQGVRYSFKGRLFLMSLPSQQSSPQASDVDLTSESWLGREPTYEECSQNMGKAIFDNGC